MRTLLVGLSTRAMAESAHRGSYDVVSVDYFGDYDQKLLVPNYSLLRDLGTNFQVSLLGEIAFQIDFDALAYTSNLENYPEIVEKLAAKGAILGNSPSVLREIRDWDRLSFFLRAEGFKVPRTLEEPPGSSGRWVKKPLHSGGGHKISFYLHGEEVAENFVVQEYLEGIPSSASFVADGRRAVVISLTEQLIGRAEFGISPFRYCGNILPLRIAGKDEAYLREILEQVQQMVDRITFHFGLKGVNGLDFILRDGEIYALEINPRYSASMELIEMAYGINIFDLHVRACQGELPSFSLEERFPASLFFGKAILFAEKDITVGDTRGWVARGIRDVPFPGDKIKRGQPICTLLATARGREECLSKLVAQAQELKRVLVSLQKAEFQYLAPILSI
ncbi:hypothetical protein HKBW3S03_01306 [Candidatus Hakubella thermalkaliphila]|uniref:ATP-grasp domain-containing protein n=3 Tax=Candidatus Hakubella thermalkaliphila TaxID=2754717 RepID=A0A6V8NHM2_9ACTN|nr:ATP-grasp domain-containing protein [Candidatus Hakubella thermalkaliphila]GFP19802.1 hypothetical protein HKBW3S03_01306 [Candidatus Hakubella thermalkaliphila]GFP30758.1 hypothetical protein HKBW3S34_01677 [Candidatus Hakubella thermalkaliphila]GFP39988.1 hypothetical protein HKBW3S47_01685 [Candidatus Hakubella thermalkaliphila]